MDEYSNAEAGAAEGITGAVLGESETSGAEVYEYDVFGKMEQIQKGNQTIRYGYNADGQRIEKTVNSQSTEYIWDGDNIVSEKTGDGSGIYYQRGLGLIASAQGDEYYRDFYFKNAHGDVTGVYYAGNNSQKASYEYDPFGKQIDPNAAGEELLSGSYEGDPNDSNPYRYASEYFDRETGSIYLRARYYDPSYGRFTSEDTHWNPGNMIYGDNNTGIPSMQAIMQSSNLYVYCTSNPINFVDPLGLVEVLLRFAIESNGGKVWQGYDSEGTLTTYAKLNGITQEFKWETIINGRTVVKSERLAGLFCYDENKFSDITLHNYEREEDAALAFALKYLPISQNEQQEYAASINRNGSKFVIRNINNSTSTFPDQNLNDDMRRMVKQTIDANTSALIHTHWHPDGENTFQAADYRNKQGRNIYLANKERQLIVAKPGGSLSTGYSWPGFITNF